MKRNHEIRITTRMEELIRMSRILIQAAKGRKLTKAAMAERLIDLGAETLFQLHGWEIPDDLRP